MMSRLFTNRVRAGQVLGDVLAARTWRAPVVVVGLPRGGVPVAAEVASRLGSDLDVIVVRKIGAPHQEELACGAIAPRGVVVWNDRVLRALGLRPEDLTQAVAREERELARRESAIRSNGTPAISLRDRSVILVDDGIATGATMRAAVRAVKSERPRELVIALPVGPDDTCDSIEREEECSIVCARRVPSGSFGSVGEWYDDFSQVETEECRDLLETNRTRRHTAEAAAAS